jgi:hypothetical protein
MDPQADVALVEVTSIDKEHEQMLMFAKLAAQLLATHYPNHMWMVGFVPGMTLVIKNMAIDDGRYGFTVDVAKAATISECEKAIIFGGGELLERCGVARGAWDGEALILQNKEFGGIGQSKEM